VSKPVTKRVIRVIVDIKPVKLVEITPAQQQLLRKFWTRLIAEARDEVKNGP